MTQPLKVLDLFAGIGGFSLGLERTGGFETVAFCEIDKYCQKILAKHWPDVPVYSDVRLLDGSMFSNVDVIVGGFPCQDASLAKQDGKGQKGLEGDRTGLWTEMVRAIKEIQPKYVVAENVSNILRTNNGRDWRTILRELDGMGYNAEWRVTRASELGACHHRSRCYLVAYPNSIRLNEGESFFSDVLQEIPQKRRLFAGTSASIGVSWETEPIVSGLDDGIPKELDGITFPKWRRESIKAYGNAVVPPLILQIFKAIQEFENQSNDGTPTPQE